MFLNLDLKERNKTAIIDTSQNVLTYGQVIDYVNNFPDNLQTPSRTLALLLMRNDAYSALNFISCFNNRIVPILISERTNTDSLKDIIEKYHPSVILGRSKFIEKLGHYHYMSLKNTQETDYCKAVTDLKPFPLYKNLSLLLTTSGSTGSPKFVRHSYRNIEYQAEKISRFFEMNGTERPLIDLPIMYTYGLSILNSYLYAGATLLLSDESFTKKQFWDFFKENEATSLTGVPYTFEMLKRLRFFGMDLPSLKMLSQGGGKLSPKTQFEFAKYIEAKGGRYYATYGASEGSARMSFLPYNLAIKKCGSIGKPVGNDKMYLRDEEGNILTKPNEIGELYFEGENVTLGYAESGDDLIKCDERNGILATGDMAYFDEEGFFYITGRKKRFLKLFGHRVSLDECESMVKNAFNIDCACTGDDNKLYICLEQGNQATEIKKFLLEKTNLYASAIETKVVENIPKNEAGKILYTKLKELI